MSVKKLQIKNKDVQMCDLKVLFIKCSSVCTKIRHVVINIHNYVNAMYMSDQQSNFYYLALLMHKHVHAVCSTKKDDYKNAYMM